MATVTLTSGASKHSNKTKSNVPYVLSRTVTAAECVAEKGSALAAADVLQVIDIPANTHVHWARLYVVTADTGTTLTMDLGYGSNVDVYSDGVDVSGSTGWGALGTNGKINGTTSNLFTAADTLDLVIASLSAANDDWVVQVCALVTDLTPPVIPESTFD